MLVNCSTKIDTRLEFQFATRVIGENIELNERRLDNGTLSFSFQGQCRREKGEKLGVERAFAARFLFVISVFFIDEKRTDDLSQFQESTLCTL